MTHYFIRNLRASTNQLYRSIIDPLIAATLVLVLFFGSFLFLEPVVGRAATSTFRITQQVTAEISFVVSANNVAMSPSLPGITGGTSAGTTSVRVRTNNDIGYNMTIAFSSSTAMHQTSQGNSGIIGNYTPSTVNVPDFTFTSRTASQFGYTVIASTTADMVTLFKDTGAACNGGANNTANTCWMNPSTTAQTIINRSTPTANSGSTSTVAFRINIPNGGGVPLVPEGGYTATATLTAVIN